MYDVKRQDTGFIMFSDSKSWGGGDDDIREVSRGGTAFDGRLGSSAFERFDLSEDVKEE